MNWYNYVGGDPVNFVDPLGLEAQRDGSRICFIENWFIGYYNLAGRFIGRKEGSEWQEIHCWNTGIDVLNQKGRDHIEDPNEIVVTALPVQGPPDCISPTDGPVYFVGGGLDVVLVLGGGITLNKFYIPSKNASGWAATGSFLGGGGAFAGVNVGGVNNFGNFTGDGWKVDAAPFPVVGGESIFGDSGNWAGGAVSFGAGGGGYGGRTKTRVLSLDKPVCR